MVAKFEEQVHNFGPGVQIAYLDGNELKAAWFLTQVDRLRSQTIQGVNVRLEEIREEPYTGLEVSGDPGVFVVWAGFALMLFGLYVNFFTYYRRIIRGLHRGRNYHRGICVEKQRGLRKRI